MLITGACGAAGGAAGAATAPPPPPMPPIIIIIIIICIGSLWLLFWDSALIESVIWLSIIVSWSLLLFERAVTRDAPPATWLSWVGSIDWNGLRCMGFDMGLSLFRPVVRVLVVVRACLREEHAVCQHERDAIPWIWRDRPA